MRKISLKAMAAMLTIPLTISTVLWGAIPIVNAADNADVVMYDFENQKGFPKPQKATNLPIENCLVEIDNTTAHSGQYSQKLTMNLTDVDITKTTYFSIQQKPPVSKPVGISFWIKTTDFAKITVRIMDKNKEYFDMKYTLDPNNSDWQHIVLPANWDTIDKSKIPGLESRTTFTSGSDKGQVLDYPIETLGFIMDKGNLPTSKRYGTRSIWLDDIVALMSDTSTGTSTPAATQPPATTQPPVAKKFSDISDSHWAKDAIYSMVSKGIIKGLSDTEFAPERNITRAEFTSLVARLMGLTPATYQNAYNDVTADQWYAGTVQVAFDNGLIDEGMTPNGNFSPQSPITREEMTSLIIRAYEKKTGASAPQGNIDKFTDKDQISAWASRYVDGASSIGIVSGMTATEFVPKNNATRAQAAVMIKRLLDKI